MWTKPGDCSYFATSSVWSSIFVEDKFILGNCTSLFFCCLDQVFCDATWHPCLAPHRSYKLQTTPSSRTCYSQKCGYKSWTGNKVIMMIICCVCLLVWAGWLSDWVAEWLTNPLTNWPLNPLTGWLNEWPNNWWTDWMTNGQTVWLSHWLTDPMTDWMAEWLTDWLTYDWLTDWITDWINDKTSDSLTDWLTEWVIDRLTEWLSDWQEWLSTDWMIAWLIQWLTRRNEWYTEGACIFSCLSCSYRTWEEGKALIIDDSFDHEVWHNGSTFRLILIVDFWHPDLTPQQRASLSPI